MVVSDIRKADSCCGCSHGARCSCALKKEHLDPVPESDSDEPAVPAVTNDRRRPRASTAQSENSLTTFVNGHHKPVHKHNTMAHKCGLPYVVPRSHTIHGLAPTGLANRSVDNLPHTNTVDALHSDSHIKDSIVSAQKEQRMVKSEHGSPIVSPGSNLNQWNSSLPPLDLTNLSGDYSACLDGFSSVPDDQPLFSAGLSAASIDWSHYDGLDFNNDTFAASSYSQAPSFTGYDFSSIEQSALTTTSTSGEISEVEDFGSLNDPANARPSLLNTAKYGSDFDTSDIGGDLDGYRLSTASSYVGIPQAQMLAGNNVEALDMETFLKSGPSPGNNYANMCDGLPATSYPGDGKLAQPSQYDDTTNFPLLSADDDAFWMSNFTPSTYNTNDVCGDLSEENLWAQ
jgi:hypothetical protein